MQGFEEVTLSWQGNPYVVPANNQMMLVAKVEAAIYNATGKPAVMFLTTDGAAANYAAISMAYAAALQHAGASVTEDQVYLSLQNSFAEGDSKAAIAMQGAVMGLLAIISPPVHRKIVGDVGAEKKSKTKPKKKASSKPSTASS